MVRSARANASVPANVLRRPETPPASIDTWLEKIVRAARRPRREICLLSGKFRIRESPKTNIVETKEVAGLGPPARRRRLRARLAPPLLAIFHHRLVNISTRRSAECITQAPS